jgi:hypothetical protein
MSTPRPCNSLEEDRGSRSKDIFTSKVSATERLKMGLEVEDGIYQNEYCIKYRVIEKATGFRNLKILDNVEHNVEPYN